MGKKVLILYVVTALLGVLTGLIASLFQLSIAWLDGVLQDFLNLAHRQGWPAGLISAALTMSMIFWARRIRPNPTPGI